MKAWGLTPTQWAGMSHADQSVILAHETNQAELCPSCGSRLDAEEPIEIVRHECKGCQLRSTVDTDKKPKPGVFYAVRRIFNLER